MEGRGGRCRPPRPETTYHFEYGTGSGTEGRTALQTLPVVDSSDHLLAVPVQGLTPGTIYHYRLLATNEVGTVEGPELVFTTQAAGGPLALPDGRQYELVSPPEKDGAQVLGIIGTVEGTTPGGSAATQASADGSGVSYLTDAPVGANPPGNVYATQLLSKRGSSGWSTQNISPAHEGSVGTQL